MILQIITSNSDVEDAITVASVDETNKSLGTGITWGQFKNINHKLFNKKRLTKAEKIWVAANKTIRAETMEKVKPFIRYHEEIYIDFDFEKNTATIVPRG